MRNGITLPYALLEADAKTLWVYAHLAAIVGDGSYAEIKVSQWCGEIGLSHQQLRDALKYLATTNKITIKTTNKSTYITICGADFCSPRQQCREQTKKQAKEQTVISKTSSVTLSMKPCMDFVNPAFEDAFSAWIEYKKNELRETYKTERTMKAAYKKLVELSGNDPGVAMQIVEQSMAYRWKGLYELKENGTKQQYSAVDSTANRAESRRRMSALASEIVSRSETLLHLYDGQGADTDNSQN